LGKKKNNHKMKNRVFVFFVMLIMFSCKEEKIEFVQSKVKPSTFLLKNLPRDDKFIKEEIKSFLSKNLPHQDSLIKKEFIIAENFYQKQIFFYRYTWDTSYFIENKEDTDGGFSDNSLSDYPEDKIATFFISKCEKDSTKLVGELYFYGNAGFSSKREIDTLIYHCK